VLVRENPWLVAYVGTFRWAGGLVRKTVSAMSRQPFDDDIERLLERVCAARRGYRLPLRIRGLAEQFARDVLGFLFPHFTHDAGTDPREMGAELERLRALLVAALARPSQGDAPAASADELADCFIRRLPAIYDALLADARATYEGDPAATSVDEVILAYPGFLALACYRIAHEFYALDVPLFPRLVTEYAHRATGVDIHPGATIGTSCAIDHGTGIVIGESAVLGDRVKLYQGVTLGALSVDKSLARTKRHPTIEDDVVIYANATILGGDTVVGAGSVIGGNVWLTHSVPPKSVVTHTGMQERKRGAEDLLEFNI
jgi:serine O-acetyltransferase